MFIWKEFHIDPGEVVRRKCDATVPENANLSLISNTEVEEDGISLTKDGDTVWKVGNGGTKYNFEFSDGNLVVRNASLLNSY